MNGNWHDADVVVGTLSIVVVVLVSWAFLNGIRPERPDGRSDSNGWTPFNQALGWVAVVAIAFAMCIALIAHARFV